MLVEYIMPSMKILDNWTLLLAKLPSYVAFKGTFDIDIDVGLLNLIMKSDHPEFTKERKSLLSNVIEKIDKKTSTLKIKHNQRYGLGRFYPDNSISPICLSRHIKHTLFHHLNYIDLDMVKGHPTIIYNIAKMNNIELPTFEKYLKDPTHIFQQLIEYYSATDETPLTEDNVKDIFNISIYGGGHKTWIEQMSEKGIELATCEPHSFVVQFIKECKIVMELIYLNNKDIVSRVKGNLSDEYQIKSRTMSYWCGAVENEIIHICYKFLVKRGIIIDKKNVVLEYDGICFKQNDEVDSELLDSVLCELNDKILKETSLQVTMKWKGYKSENIHSEIIEALNESQSEISETDQSEDSDDDYESFKEVSWRFERNHLKIKNKGIFIKELDDTIIAMSKSHIITSYEHMTYMKESVKKGITSYTETNFISDWLRNNSSQRCYDDIECYPKGISCPPNIFNTWKPFAMENVKHYEPNPVALKLILQHIKILCGNDDMISDYFIKWVAQMIQYPGVKSKCPTIISQEGAGKGTLMRLFEKMLGSNKVFETANPSRDVWGDFNGRMANVFLVNLNELSKKETADSEGKIKTLITDPRLTINNENVDPYDIYSYHRFIITTNKEEPINTTKDDRRKFIFRSSDELCGNKEYFNKMYELLDDVNVIKTCYEYFNSIEGMDKFDLIPMPVSNYQKELQKLSASPIETWLEYFTLENEGKIQVEEPTKYLFDSFVKWATKNMPDYKINLVAFGVRLDRLKIDGIIKGSHTKQGNTKIFDIALLKKHFGIGCLIELKNDDNKVESVSECESESGETDNEDVIKKVDECDCGLKISNICKCKNPTIEIHKLSKNKICKGCDKWLCRC